MAKKSTKEFIKTERVKDEPTTTKDQTPSAEPTSGLSSTSPVVDLQKVIEQSKIDLQTNPVKRKRATKAEMQARASGIQTQAQAPQINFAALPEQDFTMATEPLLRGLDLLSANFVAAQEKVDTKNLKADLKDIQETAKTLNKPLTILSAHYGAGANPVNGAWFAIGMTIGGMFLGKYFAAQDLKGSE